MAALDCTPHPASRSPPAFAKATADIPHPAPAKSCYVMSGESGVPFDFACVALSGGASAGPGA
jgi:hypothetical protein